MLGLELALLLAFGSELVVQVAPAGELGLGRRVRRVLAPGPEGLREVTLAPAPEQRDLAHVPGKALPWALERAGALGVALEHVKRQVQAHA